MIATHSDGRRHRWWKIRSIVLLFITLLSIRVGRDTSNVWEIIKIVFVFRSYIIIINWVHANCSHSLNLADAYLLFRAQDTNVH